MNCQVKVETFINLQCWSRNYKHDLPRVKDGTDATRTSTAHKLVVSTSLSTVSAARSLASRSLGGPNRTTPPATSRSSTPSACATTVDTFGRNVAGMTRATARASDADASSVEPGGPGS